MGTVLPCCPIHLPFSGPNEASRHREMMNQSWACVGHCQGVQPHGMGRRNQRSGGEFRTVDATPLNQAALTSGWRSRDPSSGIRVIPGDFIPLHFPKSAAAAARPGD